MLSVVALVNPYKGIVVPVTPRKTSVEAILLRFFRVLTGFLYHYMYNCFATSCN